MKYFFGICLWFCSLSVWGQMITAPAPLTIEANASNVDAGDFVVNWANNTDQILVSLSLDYHNGATLSFPTTTGLTKNYGYNSWTSVSSIVFYGTRDNINAGLAAMTISMGSVKTAVKINIEVSTFDASYIYNPTNKHYYKFISGAVTYSTAKSGATAQAAFKGKSAYLATITSQAENDFINNNISQNNIWVAMSDAANEGQWIFDAGPEANINFWNTTVAGITNTTYTSYAATGNTVSGQYSNWCANEPNNSDGSRNGEDCIVAKSGGSTCWNDLADGNSGGIGGYLIEFSEDFPAGTPYTGVYTSYTVHNNDLAFTKSSTSGISSTGISNVVNLSGGLTINDGHTVTLNANNSFRSNKIIFNGTGKLVLNAATSKWSAENASTNNTLVYSPAKNSNPVNWDPKSIWAGDLFVDNNPNGTHYTPWLGSPQGWSAGAGDITQYITLIYPIPAYIAGIATQGRQNMAQWVKNADIDVSLNGTTWTSAKINATLNTDQTSIVNVLFDSPVYAKYVRVKFTRATDWNGHPSMRLGLIIKSYDFNIITDGLKLRLDAGESSSYGGSGTTWSDISGNTQNFSLVNSPTYDASGFFNFNGTTQYASIPHNNTLKPTAAITLEQWLNANNWAAGTSGTNYKCSLSCTSGGGYSHNIWASTFKSYIYAANAYRILSGSVSGFTGWHHFVSTFDGRYARLYVDGQNVDNIDLAASGYTMTYATNSIFIGVEAGTATAPEGFYWDGKIGTTLIYNRALSTAEVMQNFYNTKAKYGL